MGLDSAVAWTGGFGTGEALNYFVQGLVGGVESSGAVERQDPADGVGEQILGEEFLVVALWRRDADSDRVGTISSPGRWMQAWTV